MPEGALATDTSATFFFGSINRHSPSDTLEQYLATNRAPNSAEVVILEFTVPERSKASD